MSYTILSFSSSKTLKFFEIVDALKLILVAEFEEEEE